MQRIFVPTITALLLITAFYSCEKPAYEMRADYVDLSNKAFVRFIHASPSFRILNGNQRDTFNVMVDGKKLNGTALSYGGIFPAATSSSYAIVDAGVKTYSLTIGGVSIPDSVFIRTLPADTLRAGIRRSVYITDSGYLRIDDGITTPLTGLYSLRFVNLVVNDTAGKAVDIYSARRNSNIFTNIKPINAGGTFSNISLAYNAQLNDTLFVRRAGTSFNLAQGTLASGLAFLPGNQRTYTLIYRGDGNLTTGTKARTLAIITNQ